MSVSDDGLQAFSVGRVAKRVGVLVETVTIMLLQRTQFGHRVVPALRARAPIAGLSGVDGSGAGLGGVPGNDAVSQRGSGP